MVRQKQKNILPFIVVVLMAVACQLDAGQRIPALVARQTATFTPSATATPTSTPLPTATFTPTQTPTPTITPTPTATPIPSDRLARANRAYMIGDYATARSEFAALLDSPGASVDEKRQALHWRGRSELALGDLATAIISFRRFLQQYPSDALARSAQFNLGVAYERAGQWPEAIQAYRGCIIPDDPINAYIYERIGDVAMEANRYDEAATAYRAGRQAIDDVGFQVHLREGAAQAELAGDDPAAALSEYEAILQVAEIGAYRAKILRLQGEAYLANGEPEAAHESYLEAVERYPAAADSYLALIELVEAEVPVDPFQRGLVDYYAGAYQPAIAAFGRYLAAEEPPPRAGDALWFTALSWQKTGGYNMAIHYFERLIETYPTHPEWGQAHLEIGQCRVDQDNISRAKTAFRSFAGQYPEHPLAGEALWRAARLDLDGDRLAEALVNLRELAADYPDNEYADDALYWAGWAAFQLDETEEALSLWADLAERYPASDLLSRGQYWRAKLLLEQDRQDQAERILTDLTDESLDYYAVRARDLLAGRDPHPIPLVVPDRATLAAEQAEAERWLAGWLGRENGQILAEPGPEIRNDPAFRRGEALLGLGLRAESLAEFEQVKDNWWGDPLAMYQLSLYFGRHQMGRLSIISAARLIFLSPLGGPEEAPLFIQRLYYPIYFADEIFAEAERHQLDPALILALMRQESLFEYSAESVAGARGLMQVMPPTGEYIAQHTDFAAFHPDQLWLPYISIQFGAWYIDQQLGMFDGNQFAALAAYNAGPGHVLDWMERWEELDIFVESIPFWESRLYIRNIYVNLAAYRRVYGAAETAN